MQTRRIKIKELLKSEEKFKLVFTTPFAYRASAPELQEKYGSIVSNNDYEEFKRAVNEDCKRHNLFFRIMHVLSLAADEQKCTLATTNYATIADIYANLCNFFYTKNSFTKALKKSTIIDEKGGIVHAI